MIAKSFKAVLFLLLLGSFSYAVSGDKPTVVNASSEEQTIPGDIQAGEERYNKTCINCHGAAGKGVASYPEISGKDIAYTTSKLETEPTQLTRTPF